MSERGPYPWTRNIRERLIAAGVDMRANAHVGHALNEGEIELIEQEVAGHVAAMLDALLIDRKRDHNTADTPQRVAKMLVREVFAGRYVPPPPVTDFPNVSQLDQLYVVGPIAVRSACSHHLVPIMGSAWIGVVPGERVIGLSKFGRIAEWIMGRPQIQEEATVMLADEIERLTHPLGLGVVVKAAHLCCSWRGLKDQSEMTTSVMRGVLRDDPAARSEFLTFIGGHRFTCR